jgi:hypothetical protein
MLIFHLVVSAWMLLAQVGNAAAISDDIFTPGEKAQLASANNAERRIKVYNSASKRLQQELETAVTQENFQSVPGILQAWTFLLDKSLKDIETNLTAKKKSRALINYEIQLRKSITRTENLKIKSTADLQDPFDSCLERAEKIRGRFVEILFRH